MKLAELGRQLCGTRFCPGRDYRLHSSAGRIFGLYHHETCTGTQVLRKGTNSELFWGCSKFPACYATSSWNDLDIPYKLRKRFK